VAIARDISNPGRPTIANLTRPHPPGKVREERKVQESGGCLVNIGGARRGCNETRRCTDVRKKRI
jgi:hypothetical protein